MSKSGRRACFTATGTRVASGTSEPGPATSVIRCPAAASPRASVTTIRWVPPYSGTGSRSQKNSATCMARQIYAS